MTLEEGFDQLQAASEKLSGLLKEREIGLHSWHLLVKDAINNLDKALEEFTGPRNIERN